MRASVRVTLSRDRGQAAPEPAEATPTEKPDETPAAASVEAAEAPEAEPAPVEEAPAATEPAAIEPAAADVP